MSRKLPRAKPKLDWDSRAVPYVPPASADEPLWTQGDPIPVTTPAPRPTPDQERRFEPSQADRAAAAEMSARGAFRPPVPTRPVDVRKTGRWGTAVANYANSLKRQK
jgi:hypothetical protein